MIPILLYDFLFEDAFNTLLSLVSVDLEHAALFNPLLLFCLFSTAIRGQEI